MRGLIWVHARADMGSCRADMGSHEWAVIKQYVSARYTGQFFPQ